MKVKELKAILDLMDAEMEVLLPGVDHSYNKVRGATQTAAVDAGGDFYEWHESDGAPVQALVIH